jgi:hypothetical protein
MAEPASHAMFYCQFKQPAADGTEGAEISVAYYFEHLANPRKALTFPWLPGKDYGLVTGDMLPLR